VDAPTLPDRVQSVLARLEGAGLQPYVVGGALRDLLLDRPVHDFDLVIDAELREVAARLPEGVAIDAQTPIVAIPADPGGPRIEISRFRGDAKTLEEDLRLRDFTVNAIAFDPRTRGTIDPLGGLADLANGVLRATDPDRAFRDDPPRILRGIRMALELALTIDDETVHAMERDSSLLVHAPGERLRDELLRLLELPEPDRGLAELRRVGALAAVLPELLHGCGVDQNRSHSDTVWTHTLRVCRLVPPRPLLRLGALLHDVAKPDARDTSSKSGEATFYRHEVMAAPYVRAVAERLRLSRRDEDVLARLVRHHLLFPHQLETDAAIRRMIRRVGRDILPDLLELRRADYASRGDAGALAAWEAAEGRIRELAGREPQLEAPRLAIGGHDVMRELGLEEGTRVGEWLRRATLHIIDHPEENQRGQLLRWLRRAAREEAE
jgi:tRNA nucleotidyltransferase (CCA-adding enzyme)